MHGFYVNEPAATNCSATDCFSVEGAFRERVVILIIVIILVVVHKKNKRQGVHGFYVNETAATDCFSMAGAFKETDSDVLFII